MERYKKYKAAFPNKTDAQCIESLCYEVSDKAETIHKLLAEIELLRKPINIKSVCDCEIPMFTMNNFNYCHRCQAPTKEFKKTID